MGAAFAAAALLMSAACKSDAGTNAVEKAAASRLQLTIHAGNGPHVFSVEIARTPDEQERGLMFRTNIPADSGMLFAPYPAEGGGPRAASFWMKNTPSPLDIIFIRPDGTIARIAENTVPYSEDHIDSGEPVSAVLEINGGRSAELGISAGDRVTWAGHGD
ncbi:MAG: DUF192 domain-containing protein [Sphingomonas sp.]